MMQLIIRKTISSLLILTAILCSEYSFAFINYSIGPEKANIQSSIKYSVIGKYRAEFDNYQAQIEFDKDTQEIRFVYLKIDAASIRSNCGWCDKIVRSKQLLHVEKYPDIIFESHRITKDNEVFMVHGTLDFHGEIKELSFPFSVVNTWNEASELSKVNAQGQWNIKRKEFNVVWNKYLDKGGVLVGDIITVDWEILLPHS